MRKGRTTRAIGIRLPLELVQAIDAQAHDLGMSRNELLGRRLAKAFGVSADDRKTAYIDRETAPAFRGLPE